MTDLRKVAEMALEALEEYTSVVQSGTDPNKWHEVVDGGAPARKAIQALRQALAEPVDAVNTSQERVDETAKGEHEWKGLDGEIPGLGLVTEEFYNGMLFAEDVLRERNGG